jgi:hypothetical protein
MLTALTLCLAAFIASASWVFLRRVGSLGSPSQDAGSFSQDAGSFSQDAGSPSQDAGTDCAAAPPVCAGGTR